MRYDYIQSSSALILAVFLALGSVVVYAENAEEYYRQAGQYMSEGKPEEAIQEYQKVLGTGVRHPDVYTNLGRAYAQLRTQEGFLKAVESYRKAIDADPKYEEAYAELGSLYISRQDFPAAVQAFKKQVEINPASSRGYFGLGWSYLMGRLDNPEAIKAFQKAVETGPDFPEAYLGLGLAYIANNEKAMALEPITQLRKMNRHDLANTVEDAIRTGEAIQQEALEKKPQEKVPPAK
jgi:tetratricopeptide (TPR) repeat protein